jgi:hypothetical protein
MSHLVFPEVCLLLLLAALHKAGFTREGMVRELVFALFVAEEAISAMGDLLADWADSGRSQSSSSSCFSLLDSLWLWTPLPAHCDCDCDCDCDWPGFVVVDDSSGEKGDENEGAVSTAVKEEEECLKGDVNTQGLFCWVFFADELAETAAEDSEEVTLVCSII